MEKKTEIGCIWEHRGEDTILWAVDYPGAFARGASLKEALAKLAADLAEWSAWTGLEAPEEGEAVVIGEVESTLNVRDADSDVLLDGDPERERK